MRAKEMVYWLGINQQLEQLIVNCQLCLKYSRSKDKNTLDMALGHEIPSVPWSKVATDIFHRSQLPMSNAACRQLEIATKQPTTNKKPTPTIT